MMRRLFLLALFFFFILGNTVFAQLEVKEGSFRMVRGFVNINPDKMYDDNNQPYAVLKIKTENIGSKERRELSFKGDAQTFFEVEYRDGEVWVYLSYYASFIKISHEEYSSTEFYFPFDMKPKCGYELTLVNNVYAPTTTPKDRFNYLIITSDQPNAVIYIDDVYIGDGQVSKSFKVGDRHRWRMECNMYHTESGEVTILADQKVRIEKKMFPAFGYLTITSQPENGATVFIDGTRVGVTPYKSDRLASGEHKIRIIKEMFGATEQTVMVTDEETLNLDLTMRANFAMVNVTTDSQSDIYIDDEKKGTGTWSGRLSAGEHLFEAKKASHKTSVMTAHLEENSNKSLFLDNPEPIYGSVDINSDPMDCIIYVDGVRKGETPAVLNNILIGDHQIRLEKEGYKTITKSITVTEDKLVSINEKLTKGFNIPSGLVAYYPFEGNANDMSGNDNNGKPEGATFTTGFMGQCAHFGGFHNSQIIRIPNSNTLKFDNAATFAFWFKLDSYDGMDGYGRKSSEGLMRFYAKNFDRGQLNAGIMRDKGNFKVFADNNSTWCEATIHDNAVNKWHHAVVIYTTNYMKVYVDGVEVANVHKSFYFNSSNNCDLVLGRLSSTWYPLHGCLDEFYVFNRELNESEISSIYNNRSASQAQQTAGTNIQPTGEPSTKQGKLPDSRHWNMIYSQSDETYCNGVYGNDAKSFVTRLNNINRNHFRIVFNFQAQENNNPKGQWALMLSTGYRIIGVLLTPDGEIQISTNNQRNYYPTGLRYTQGAIEYIDLEFNNGTIIINGVTIRNVDLNRTDGDNTLTSINYSNGIAFHGIIKNVKVYNRK